METGAGLCFVIMPFKSELHYFYLFLKQHIERRHNIVCERADEQVLTEPVLDKIKDYIKRADVIVADCSGRNPNVFYEIGMAHALDKKVILITSDEIREVPSDIRHYQFIRYDLANHVDLIGKLDRAIRLVFLETYSELYRAALELLGRFEQASGATVRQAAMDVFIDRVEGTDPPTSLPRADDPRARAAFLLPRIVADSYDSGIMAQINAWLLDQQANL